MQETVSARNPTSEETDGCALGTRPGVFTTRLWGPHLSLAILAVESWQRRKRSASHGMASSRVLLVPQRCSSMEVLPLTEGSLLPPLRSLPRTCLHVPHHRLRILSGLKSGKLEKYIWSEALTSLKNRSSIHQSKLEKMSMPLAARSPMARLPRCLTQLSVASSTSVPCTQPASAQARRDILPSVLFEEG